MLRGLLPTLVFDIVAPLVTYYALRGAGLGVVAAYLLSGVWPVAKVLVGIAAKRRVDVFGLIVIMFIVFGVAIALVSGDPRVVVARDSLLTGGFGVALLVSLLFPRPLLFYVGRTFATDGSEAGMARWDGLWQYPSFRRSQIQITAMWGIAYTLEAVARVVMVYTMSDLDLVIGIFGVAPALITAVLIGATIMIGKRAAAGGAARQRAREQGSAAGEA